MIAILKYNGGNTRSVENAVRKLGYDCIITNTEEQLLKADKVIFPGVGEAGSAMDYLTEKGLDKTIRSLKQPVLGICLGLQLMCNSSEESNAIGLGIFDAVVKKFPPQEQVPHMGWNTLYFSGNPLFKGIETTDDVYFVHSYYAETSKDAIATCDYIIPFSAGLQKDNFYAVQFHPEKSGKIGEQILKNFLEL